MNHCGEKYTQTLEKEIACDLVFGACMVFKASIVDMIGYLPEAYFLFYEESEWCLNALKCGKENICLPNHFIVHKGSVSVKRTGGLSDYLIERNRMVFAKRNLNIVQFILFLQFDFLRLLYHHIRFKTPVIRYIKYHFDGLTGNVDKRFPFIWINKDN